MFEHEATSERHRGAIAEAMTNENESFPSSHDEQPLEAPVEGRSERALRKPVMPMLDRQAFDGAVQRAARSLFA